MDLVTLTKTDITTILHQFTLHFAGSIKAEKNPATLLKTHEIDLVYNGPTSEPYHQGFIRRYDAGEVRHIIHYHPGESDELIKYHNSQLFIAFYGCVEIPTDFDQLLMNVYEKCKSQYADSHPELINILK